MVLDGLVDYFFFFQAEDGIRDLTVTGVQTCALPILAEDREQSSLDGFWSTITAEQRASIEAVALDMWDPYLASLQNHLPAAEEKIVFDKFHVAGHLGEADRKSTRLNSSHSQISYAVLCLKK